MTRLLLADRVKGRQDSFMAPLLPALSREYDVRFISEPPGDALADAIRDADLVWLEWCWDHAVWATQSGVLAGKPCVIRLHSIEALQTDYPARVDWAQVSCLVTVGKDITDLLLARFPAIAGSVPIRIIPNGIDMERFAPGDPDRFRVAWVGHLEPKKNPMLLFQIAHRLHRSDERYSVHIAGPFTDLRTQRYAQRLIPALGLNGVVRFDGIVTDMPAWYADKGVLLSTSMYESFGMNIGEAMAVGAFPVIHDFPGADLLWPAECLFDSVDEAVALIRSGTPGLYREWVGERYGLEQQEWATSRLLGELDIEAGNLSTALPSKAGSQPGRERGVAVADAPPEASTDRVTWRGHDFRTIRDPAVAGALASFRSAFEAGKLDFFDAALPACDKMIDVGAYVGLMSLYAADRVAEVVAFEASPTNFDLLARNVAANPGPRDRIVLCREGLGDRDEQVRLYGKAVADSGSSIFRTIEREVVVNGAPEAMVQLRDANAALRGIGVTGRTLLKIDIEGAEYLVVPAIAALLAEAKPYLHVSFHPFNIVTGGDEYSNTVVRLRRALQIAEAVACYRFMYFHELGEWQCIEESERMIFLRGYLLQPKPLPRIASAQYGFVDAVGFSDVALAGLGERAGLGPLSGG